MNGSFSKLSSNQRNEILDILDRYVDKLNSELAVVELKVERLDADKSRCEAFPWWKYWGVCGPFNLSEESWRYAIDWKKSAIRQHKRLAYFISKNESVYLTQQDFLDITISMVQEISDYEQHPKEQDTK